MAGAFSYLFGFITGIVFLALDPYNKDRFVRFHAFQSIFLSVGWIVAWIALGIILAILSTILRAASMDDRSDFPDSAAGLLRAVAVCNIQSLQPRKVQAARDWRSGGETGGVEKYFIKWHRQQQQGRSS